MRPLSEGMEEILYSSKIYEVCNNKFEFKQLLLLLKYVGFILTVLKAIVENCIKSMKMEK